MDRLVVAILPFGRRLVVVGQHDEGGIGAGLLGVAREADGFVSRVGTGAGDHGHALAGRLDAELDHAHMLFMRECRRLAGGADGDQRVGALLDLPVDEVLEAFLVHPPVAERRDERSERTLKHCFLPRHGSLFCRRSMIGITDEMPIPQLRILNHNPVRIGLYLFCIFPRFVASPSGRGSCCCVVGSSLLSPSRAPWAPLRMFRRLPRYRPPTAPPTSPPSSR